MKDLDQLINAIIDFNGKLKSLKVAVFALWLNLWKGKPTVDDMAKDLAVNLPYYGDKHFLAWSLHAFTCGHCLYMCPHVINYLTANNEQLLHGKFYKVVAFLELEAARQKENK